MESPLSSPRADPPPLKVAAVIATYNSASLLPGCIDSILSQTYPVDEIVVVDDGSQDNTREVVEAYPHPVRYLWQTNRGVSAARNKGIQESTCPWVALLDADDRWYPDKIERQVHALAKDPMAALCYAGRTLVYPDGKEAPDPAPAVKALWPRLRYANPVTPSTLLMRRDLILGAGGFDEELKAFEDWELVCRLIRACRIVAVEEPLIWYHVGHGSLSHDIDLMLDSIVPLLEKGPLRGLTGAERWWWRQRGLSAELWRCAMRAREVGLPWRALALSLRSVVLWPSPFFLPQRYHSLAAYILRPKFHSANERIATH